MKRKATLSLFLPVTLVLLSSPGSAASETPAGGKQEPPIPAVTDPVATRDPIYARAIDYLERFRPDDLGQAIRLLNRVVKTDPDFAPAYGGLAEARAWRYLWGWEPSADDLKRAVTEGKEGVRRGPDLAQTHLGLGLAYLASDRYTPAQAELDRAVALAPDSFRAHLYRGLLFRGLKRLDETRQEVERVLSLAPSSPLTYTLSGDYYQERKGFGTAQMAYLMGALLDQDLLWARLGLAAAYQRSLNFEAAGRTYIATEQEFPEDLVRTRIMAAGLLVATRDYEGALKLYEAMPEKEELSPPLMRRLIQAGRAHALEKLDRREEAEYYWTQLIDEFPREFDGAFRDRELVSQAFEGLIRYFEDAGDAGRARKTLEHACRQTGMKYALYVKLAQQELDRGKPDRALETLRRGLLGAPGDLDLVVATETTLPILRSAATGKSGRQQRPAAASLTAEMAARLDRSDSSSYVPYLNLARSEALLGHEDQALEHLREALRRGLPDPSSIREDPDLGSLADNPSFREMTSRP